MINISAYMEEKFLNDLAQKIKQKKFEVPALLFLEIHLPLINLFHAGSLLLEPVVMPFIGIEKLEKYKNLLADRKNVEQLIYLLKT